MLGTEFEILREVPIEDILRHFGRLAAEGIRRLRNGEVTRLPGFDGEYGTIRLFRPDELENPDGQMTMAGIFGAGGGESWASDDRKEDRREACDTGDLELAGKIRDSSVRAGAEGMDGNILEADFLARLNEGQRRAAEHPARAVAVIAGPGTRKDRNPGGQDPLPYRAPPRKAVGDHSGHLYEPGSRGAEGTPPEGNAEPERRGTDPDGNLPFHLSGAFKGSG